MSGSGTGRPHCGQYSSGALEDSSGIQELYHGENSIPEPRPGPPKAELVQAHLPLKLHRL